jgi:hypothetical protein
VGGNTGPEEVGVPYVFNQYESVDFFGMLKVVAVEQGGGVSVVEPAVCREGEGKWCGCPQLPVLRCSIL